MKIVFLHPDLGIGGAERLIIDAAVALKSQNHSVHIITNHHDANHCFEETKNGTLDVTVVGSKLPRNIFGKCAALCAYLRMIVAAWFLVFKSNLDPDVVICDQISACIPILKWHRAKIIFYCHFPDQLLTKRESIFKKIYRAPLDYLEEKTTGMADAVLVNSYFTAGVFRKTFKRLQKTEIQVLYPSLNFSAFDKPLQGDFSQFNLRSVRTVFLSINRYERKKNLSLAIHALRKLFDSIEYSLREDVHLIIAGGYDNRVLENIEYEKELTSLATALGIENYVTFLRSPSDNDKQLLLHSCTAVIYTPENEHFGIVPLEAMYMNRPVIAANSGGPLETVVDNETGFLCQPNPEDFSKAMRKLLLDRSLAREMGSEGHNRVKANFSFETFVKSLCKILQDVAGTPGTEVNFKSLPKRN